MRRQTYCKLRVEYGVFRHKAGILHCVFMMGDRVCNNGGNGGFRACSRGCWNSEEGRDFFMYLQCAAKLSNGLVRVGNAGCRRLGAVH